MLLPLIALATACAGPVGSEPKPDQETALAVILGVFGVDGSAPPIQWIDAEYLDCVTGADGAPAVVPWQEAHGWIASHGKCVGGRFYERSRRIELAWPASAEHFADTFIAHEVCHAFFGDMTHSRDCFDGGGRIAEANAALLEAFPR